MFDWFFGYVAKEATAPGTTTNMETGQKESSSPERKKQEEEMLAAGLGDDRLDIYILCDTTGSMGDYVTSLVATIIQVCEILH